MGGLLGTKLAGHKHELWRNGETKTTVSAADSNQKVTSGSSRSHPVAPRQKLSHGVELLKLSVDDTLRGFQH